MVYTVSLEEKDSRISKLVKFSQLPVFKIYKIDKIGSDKYKNDYKISSVKSSDI